MSFTAAWDAPGEDLVIVTSGSVDITASITVRKLEIIADGPVSIGAEVFAG